MKSICFIVSTPLMVSFFLKNNIEVLSHEFEISLAGNFNNVELLAFKKNYITNIYYLPIKREINLIQDVRTLFILFRYFRKHKYDAIHSVGPKAGLLSSISGKCAGIKNRVHIFTGQI